MNRRLAWSLIFSVVATSHSIAHAGTNGVAVGSLPRERCLDVTADDLTPENQRYWYLRTPPYVGFAKGERTEAGGDGTCVVGFPRKGSTDAVALVNGAIVELAEAASSPLKHATYRSADGKTLVSVRITGGESTCRPNADACCGDYTYATITIRSGGKSTTLRAASYSGS